MMCPIERDAVARDGVAMRQSCVFGAGHAGLHSFEKQPTPLSGWWHQTSDDDCQAAVAKLEEYGSEDLIAVGRRMAHLMNWDDADDQTAAYLGTYFYLEGKLAREHEALRRHELPSEDTEHDISVYSMMQRRIRQTGAWQ